jgi:hypothetical protein
MRTHVATRPAAPGPARSGPAATPARTAPARGNPGHDFGAIRIRPPASETPSIPIQGVFLFRPSAGAPVVEQEGDPPPDYVVVGQGPSGPIYRPPGEGPAAAAPGPAAVPSLLPPPSAPVSVPASSPVSAAGAGEVAPGPAARPARRRPPPIITSDIREDSRKQDEERIAARAFRYLSEEERARYRVQRDAEGLHRTQYGARRELQPGNYGYAVSPRGSLYGVLHNNVGEPLRGELPVSEFYHSTFTGGPVRTAGFFRYNAGAGRIDEINRSSGHYRPDEVQHNLAVRGLQESGLVDENVRVGGVAPNNIIGGPTTRLADIPEERFDPANRPGPEAPAHLPPPPITLPPPASSAAAAGPTVPPSSYLDPLLAPPPRRRPAPRLPVPALTAPSLAPSAQPPGAAALPLYPVPAFVPPPPAMFAPPAVAPVPAAAPMFPAPVVPAPGPPPLVRNVPASHDRPAEVHIDISQLMGANADDPALYQRQAGGRFNFLRRFFRP